MAADGFRKDDSAQARIEILKRELAASRDLLARARDAHAGARAAFAGERATTDDLRVCLDAERLNLAELSAHLQQREAENASAIQSLTVDLAAHKADITAHKAVIAAITGSWSWRLTRPLRLAGRIARGAVRRLRKLSLTAGRTALRHAWTKAAIRRSGLFDAAWYQSTHVDLAQVRDPLEHYLAIGWREGRRPGPGFDPEYYRYANPDIATADLEPLTHYVLHGRREGRDLRKAGAWRRPKPGFGGKREVAPILPPEDLAPDRAPSIAVAVHAFYPDVFDALCPLLAEIPGRFTLLVSTPSLEAKQSVEASIIAHKLDAVADVRVTTNRGRNFGPLLSEFSAEILRHDLLLHLHTKKSLHNKSEQTAWRDDIFAGLIGADGVARSVVALFAARPEIGIVFTRTFRHMAYWANHWLQNTGHGRALFARLGVSDANLRGYIDYPVGGMFWARVRAIAPLFEIGFTYEDFPEEAGQLDGTIAHAIERCVVDLARVRGYTFAEADPEENSFHIGWSDRNLGRYELNTPERLRGAIAKARLVSFDLFDTVLQRPSVSPDAVQRWVGRLLALEVADAPDFYPARKAAEYAARAAQGFAGDVDLDLIYAHMAKAGWSDDALTRARAMETQIERALVLTRPPVVEAVRHAKAEGKRVIAVSDTYFNLEEIKALLAAAGLGGLFDDIVLSSAHGARKDRGDLWKLLLARERVAPDHWLHVGDNEVSDMQQAGDRGLSVFHVMNPAVLLQLKGFVSLDTLNAADEAHGLPTALLLGPAVARLGQNPFPLGGALGASDVDGARSLGYCVFGPALFAFTAWLAARPELRSLDRLYFFSREGWLLKPLYDRVRAALGEASLPEASYLYISRRAVLLANQAAGFDPQTVIDGPEFKGDLAGLLRGRLGFEIPADAEVDGAAAINLPEDAAAVRTALERLRSLIETQAATEAQALLAYLTQEGLTPDAKAGVVDVGYRATIQRGLQTILGCGLPGFYFGTFPEAAQTAAQGGSATGYFGDGIDPLGEAPLVRHAILLEAALTAPHGQLDHFEMSKSGAAPVFKDSSRDGADLAVLEDLHAGVLDYADDLLRWYGPAVAALDFDPVAALEPLAAFGGGRLLAPQPVIQALRVDDAFCGYGEHAIGDFIAGGGSA